MLEILTYYVYAPVYSLRSPAGSDNNLSVQHALHVVCALSVSKLAAPITPIGIGSKSENRIKTDFITRTADNDAHLLLLRTLCVVNTLECPDAKDL